MKNHRLSNSSKECTQGKLMSLVPQFIKMFSLPAIYIGTRSWRLFECCFISVGLAVWWSFSLVFWSYMVVKVMTLVV